MAYVLVTADFPSVTGEQRQKIYSCLADKNWKKVTEPGRDIDTVWYGYFEDPTNEQNAIKACIDNFVECSKPYSKVKLVIQWGPNKPTDYNLV